MADVGGFVVDGEYGVASVAGESADVAGWADAGEIVIGARADLVAVNAESPRTAGCSPDQILLTAIAQDVTDVIVDGRVVVRGGRHRLEETLAPGGIGRLLHDAIDPFWRQT